MPDQPYDKCQDIYHALAIYQQFDAMLTCAGVRDEQHELRKRCALILKDLLEANSIEAYELAERRFDKYLNLVMERLSPVAREDIVKQSVDSFLKNSTLLDALTRKTFDM